MDCVHRTMYIVVKIWTFNCMNCIVWTVYKKKCKNQKKYKTQKKKKPTNNNKQQQTTSAMKEEKCISGRQWKSGVAVKSIYMSNPSSFPSLVKETGRVRYQGGYGCALKPPWNEYYLVQRSAQPKTIHLDQFLDEAFGRPVQKVLKPNQNWVKTTKHNEKYERKVNIGNID